MSNAKRQHPPHIAEKLLRSLLPESERRALLGDYEELYIDLIQRKGKTKARLWYWMQFLRTIPSVIIDSMIWSFDMFWNYLKISFRNIWKQKVYSFINIIGLAIGMAAFLLISIYIQYELSFDRYHEKADRIYRVIVENPELIDLVGACYHIYPSYKLAPTLMAEYPEVEKAARLFKWSSSGERLFYCEGEGIFETLYYADPEIFEIFSIPFARGNPEIALREPFSVVLSERVSRKYFGDENPIGKTFSYRDSYDFKVTGIIKDMPQNSHFMMDLIVPMQILIEVEGWSTTWNHSEVITYLLLKENIHYLDLERKLPSLLERHKYEDIEIAENRKETYLLQPLKSIHLHSKALEEIGTNHDIKYVIMFASIAFLILLIACMNDINLSTARMVHRCKEIGLRKVVGADRGRIIGQFLSESLCLTFFAIAVSWMLVLLTIPSLSFWMGNRFIINPIENPWLPLIMSCIILFVGILAGSVPAFLISSFRPSDIFRGILKGSYRSHRLRNMLVTTQFSISIFIIIATVIIDNQLHLIQTKDMGFHKEKIIVVDAAYNVGLHDNFEIVKKTLRTNPEIVSVARSSSLPNHVNWGPGIQGFPSRYHDECVPIYGLHVDFDFIDLFGIPIIEGRNFSRAYPSDVGGAVIINETAAKACRWDSPIGKNVTLQGRNHRIVGIMKDFHLHSLHHPIQPLFLRLKPYALKHLFIRVSTEDVSKILSEIEPVLENVSPGFPFEYQFFDDLFARDYHSEFNLGRFIKAFASVSILIACLGLFGLASYTVEQQTKNIGIRKVLGASVPGILALLTQSCIKWIILASIMASPIAYFALNKWLQNFAYRININFWMFLLSSLAALIIALLTVGYQTIKAATANPIDSLRYE